MSKTKSFDGITSEYLNCQNNGKYYNYVQHDCLEKVPDGYYVDDTIYKTIEICPNSCKLCDKDSVRNYL